MPFCVSLTPDGGFGVNICRCIQKDKITSSIWGMCPWFWTCVCFVFLLEVNIFMSFDRIIYFWAKRSIFGLKHFIFGISCWPVYKFSFISFQRLRDKVVIRNLCRWCSPKEHLIHTKCYQGWGLKLTCYIPECSKPCIQKHDLNNKSEIVTILAVNKSVWNLNTPLTDAIWLNSGT